MTIDTRAISISLVILATISVFYVLVVGQAFLVPLAVALMVWYVINALSRTFARAIPIFDKPNWLTMLLALISIGMFFGFAIDMVSDNISAVREAAPQYKVNFDRMMADLAANSRFDLLSNVKQMVTNIEIAPLISALASTFTSMIGNVSLVLFYVMFMLLEQGTFQNKIRAIFPDQNRRGSIMSILSHAQEDIQTYLWIKTVTSSLTGIISYGVLLWVGVDFAGFWAFTIFMLNFIPTIGSIIATLFPAILAMIQFDTFAQFFIVLAAVGAIQVVVGNFLEPRLMGNSLNVSPFVVMMSLTLWGSIWGIAGMFLSVPITVMMLIVFAHFKKTRYIAILLSGDGSLKFAETDSSTSNELSRD
ncbi:AI-2E family transporter [Arenicella xantha]|uniref:Putative PurR-regulated permease PerM n=1 Tax=Arenicella xantha TaxID=644221 RepID=A0A395JVJ8_9GAMM|nr:AI-2E family transporter [Arenicella xantha]RBP53598.1 putative PurR-regulated permease PerM [Arenicella xantha]